MQINGLFFLEFYEKDGISLQKRGFFEDDYLVFGETIILFFKDNYHQFSNQLN